VSECVEDCLLEGRSITWEGSIDRVEFSCKRERLGSANDSRSVLATFAAFEYSEDVRKERVC